MCIVFDKLDKVGVDGVRAELTEKGYAPAAVEALCATLNGGEMTLRRSRRSCRKTPRLQSVSAILSAAQALADGRYGVKFDLSLVRGQGYYTGTVFEVESNEFRGAIAGGGRYDNLIGKFTNETVPAVGFSIGFERIFGILSESGFAAPKRKERIALFCEEADAAKAAALAESLRATYSVSLLARPRSWQGPAAPGGGRLCRLPRLWRGRGGQALLTRGGARTPARLRKTPLFGILN